VSKISANQTPRKHTVIAPLSCLFFAGKRTKAVPDKEGPDVHFLLEPPVCQVRPCRQRVIFSSVLSVKARLGAAQSGAATEVKRRAATALPQRSGVGWGQPRLTRAARRDRMGRGALSADGRRPHHAAHQTPQGLTRDSR